MSYPRRNFKFPMPQQSSFVPGDLGRKVKVWTKDQFTLNQVGGNYYCSSWTDLSGYGNHIVQATPANQLLYAATARNNRPGLTADGINDYLQTANGVLTTFPLEAWMVCAPTTAAVTGNTPFALGDWPRVSNAGWPNQLYAYSGAWVGPAAITDGQWIALSAYFDGVNGSVGKNNVWAAAGAHGAGGVGAGAVSVGSAIGGGQPVPMTMTEFVVIDSALLTTTERARLNNYFKLEYLL